MSPAERISLKLDLDLATEPIEGELTTAAGLSVPFVGWFGLSVALERVAGHGDATTTTPTEEPHV